MTTSKGWFISSVGAVLLACSANASDFEFSLSPQRIEPGQRAVLTLTLKHDGDDEKASILRDELFAEVKDFVVLDRTYRKEFFSEVWKIAITSYQGGKVVIPPLEVERAGRSYSSERVELEIAGGRADDDTEIREEFGRVGMPWRWKLWLAIAAGIAFLVWTSHLLRKKAKAWIQAHRKKPATEEPALEWLKSEVEALRKIAETGASAYEVSTQLSRILRTYFTKTTSNPVTAWTTREVSRHLSKDPAAQKVEHVLERCDAIHFQEGDKPSVDSLWFIQETERIFFPWAS